MASNGHARLSPSNHRWPHCPGSVREEAVYPNVSGPAALDGTGSHLLLEICLKTGRPDVRAEEWLFRTIGEGHDEQPGGWVVDKDRADRVQMALDYIARRRQELMILSLETESQSNPGFYLAGRNDWWGTVDITIRGVCRQTGRNVIEIIDYKDGRGWVSEKDNPQLIGYAAGKLAPFIYNGTSKKYNPLNNDYLIRQTIVQPRTNPVVRYVDQDAKVIWEAGKQLAVAAAATDHSQAPLIPGKHCTWCNHGKSGNCEAKAQVAMEGITLMSETENVNGNASLIEMIQTGQITPASMSSERIAAILDASALLKKMLEKVEEEALTRLQQDPNAIPRYTLGTGRGSNVWNEDEETVAKKLKGMRYSKDDIFPPKIISPAQALKLPKMTDRRKKVIESMITYTPGKPKVVPSNAVTHDVATMFIGTEAKPEPKQIEAPQPEQNQATGLNFL